MATCSNSSVRIGELVRLKRGSEHSGNRSADYDIKDVFIIQKKNWVSVCM